MSHDSRPIHANAVLKTSSPGQAKINQREPSPETNLMLLIHTMENLEASEERKFKHFLLAWLCDVTPPERWREAIEQAYKVAKK